MSEQQQQTLLSDQPKKEEILDESNKQEVIKEIEVKSVLKDKKQKKSILREQLNNNKKIETKTADSSEQKSVNNPSQEEMFVEKKIVVSIQKDDDVVLSTIKAPEVNLSVKGSTTSTERITMSYSGFYSFDENYQKLRDAGYFAQGYKIVSEKKTTTEHEIELEREI